MTVAEIVKDVTPRRIPSSLQLDGRTREAKQFRQIVRRVTQELGSLSILQESLAEAYAGARLNLDALTTSMLRDRNVEPSDYAAAVDTMMHLSECLGLKQHAAQGD